MIVPTLQTIFLLGFRAYAATHRLPGFILKAAWCIMHCRTALMGGHVQACPDGHFARNHYNSCKHRVCPLCAFIQVQRWLAKQKARILPCDHYHLIFTIPHELNCLWLGNAKLMANILFDCARSCIFQLLADPKYLGATPGVIASLHTWSKALLLHPHIHCLVTGAGLKDGLWVKLHRDYLFPAAVLRTLFRAKILASIKAALLKHELVLPGNMTLPQMLTLLKQVARKKWNVRIQEKYSHGKGVLTYLARYLRGGPISNRRIVSVQNNTVTFHIGRDKRQLLTLPIAEFIRRFLLHIPAPGCVVIRSYGLYASSKRAQLNLAHHLLGNSPADCSQPINWQDLLDCTFSTVEHKDRPWLCPVCGKRLIRKQTIPPLRKTHLGKGPHLPSTQTPLEMVTYAASG